MADIYGSHFEYGGVSSTTLGLIIANVESERFTQLAGTITGATIFNKSGKRNYLIDDDYSESPLSFEVDIISDSETAFTTANRRTIEKWLFNRHRYRKLYLTLADCNEDTSETVDEETKRLYLNCRFVNPVVIENDSGVVGYRATLEADCGYWWQDAITKTYTFSHSTDSDHTLISLEVDTDIDDYTYPKVTVTMNSNGGSFAIMNSTDDSARLTAFKEIAAGATVIINSEINYVSGQYYEKFYDQNFPRLLDGNNQITVIGNVASMTIEYSNRRNFR